MSLLIPPCPSSPHVYVAIAFFSTGGRLSSLFCAKTFSNHIVSSSLLVSPQRGVSPCFSRSMPSKGKPAELFCGTSGHEGKAHESELSLHLVQYMCRAPSYNTVLCLVGMAKLWTSTERRVRGSYHAKPFIFLQLCKQVLPVSWLHLLYLSGASQRAPLLPKALFIVSPGSAQEGWEHPGTLRSPRSAAPRSGPYERWKEFLVFE